MSGVLTIHLGLVVIHISLVLSTRTCITVHTVDQRHNGKMKEKQMEVKDLMWTFRKEHQKVGIYRDFQTLISEQPVVSSTCYCC